MPIVSLIANPWPLVNYTDELFQSPEKDINSFITEVVII